MIIFEHSMPLALTASILIAVLAVGVYSALRFLRGSGPAAPLTALFVAAIALLFWTALQPGKRTALTELIKPRFLIALDTSGSMTVAPSEDDPTRWETAQRILAMPWTSVVESECRIEVLPFDAKAGEAVSLNEAARLAPSGSVTFLRDSLREITGRYAGLNVAGMLLLSDGIDTREAHNDWAAEDRPFPIYTVRLEKDSEWKQQPELRVESVTTPQRVTRGWTTELKAMLYGQGTDDQPVTAQLFKDRVFLDEIPTKFPASGGQREVVFTLEHPEAGVYTYRVFLPPIESEANTNDNEYIVSIHVAEDRNRLLYVEGVPRWEYRFLRRALLSHPNIAPTIFYTGPDGAPRAATPAGNVTANMSESELASFHVVILGNLDAEELTEERASNLVRFVETGGSLILLGGNKAWGENGFSNTSLRKIIPVSSHGYHPLESDLSDSPFKARITDEARSHPAFAGDASSWESLPSVLSVFPDAVPALGAQVLAEVETRRGKHPIVVSHRYGQGKVVAIFTDSLWRWQLSPDSAKTRPYTRFWTQLTAWMLPEDEKADARRLDLFSNRDRVFMGERVELSARMPGDEADRPPQSIEVRISFPDGRTVPFTMEKRDIHTRSGEAFTGFAIDFEPVIPGHYTASAIAKDEQGELVSDQVSFFVQSYSQETAPRPINAELLDALAASGGRFFSDADELNDGLSKLRTAATVEEQTKFFSLWQHWLVIALLMVLLSGAWLLRKLRNMP